MRIKDRLISLGQITGISSDRIRSPSRAIAIGLIGLSTVCGPQVPAAEDSPSGLADFSLEDLGNIQITSVSGTLESLSGAPASVFVLSREDIRRAGVTSLPEALRLAPNLQVARVSASEYAISARGFNNSTGNKLLVLIDGRSVYTPLYSGVFWDAQDVLLDDIDRIEVLSGPGGTIWGVNAVTGVINVVTRPAARTQGAALHAGGGNFERSASFRYGGQAWADGNYRVYAKYRGVENTENAGGTDLPDAWTHAQLGFRADWGDADGMFSLQGDGYHGEADASPLNNLDIDGLNLLARWDRTLSNGSSLRVQAYYDHSARSDLPVFEEDLDIADIEVRHSVALGAHQLVWGGGYRHAWDDVSNSPSLAFLPARRGLTWANVFAQDTLRLTPDLALTVGGKFEDNDYTGIEFLPSLRIAWTTPGDNLLWSALSRAVRAPSRLDRELFFPGTPPYLVAGGPGFRSETANVLEVGYRAQPSEALSYSITAFHHVYDRLRSLEPVAGGQMVFGNLIDGTTSGVEAWANYQAGERWRLSGGILTLRQSLERMPGSLDPTGPRSLANDPSLQLSLRSMFSLSERFQLDLFVRHVGALPDPEVPAYTAVDARLGLSLGKAMVLSLTLQNMLDSQHAEFGAAATRSEYERIAFLAIEWRQP